jgi:DNA replication protein DnaC
MQQLAESPLLRRPLSPDDAKSLYEMFNETELPRTHNDGCPTCHKNRGKGKNGVIWWEDAEWECHCSDQLQRAKWYLASGIGFTYQRIRFEDYGGDPSAADFARKYLDSHVEYIAQGTGVMFSGKHGSGKTMMPMLMLKHLVRSGYRCYATTMDDLMQKTIDSWWGEQAKVEYKRQIDSAHIMLIDDVGKENTPKEGERNAAILDCILRERVQAARPTFITTNLTLDQFMTQYKHSTFSLLTEKAVVVTVTGEDYRPKALKRGLDEIKTGIARPIF